MALKELLKKFYDAGIMAEATLEEKYSFEQTLADNSEALQLLQTDVVGRSEQLVICKKCESSEMYQYSKTKDKCEDCGNIQDY